MIDYPAMVIPVHSAIDPVLDPIDTAFKPANDKDAEVQALYKYFKYIPYKSNAD